MATPNQIHRARNRKLPSVERVRELFSYNAETGILTRRVKAGGEVAGKSAGTRNNCGYLICRVDYGIHYVHRLAWLHYYGESPPELIDHINNTRHDNRIKNLRTADFSENSRNRGLTRANMSGVKGVSYSRANKKWKAAIGHRGFAIYLGYFETKESAAEAYEAAVLRYHREYARLR